MLMIVSKSAVVDADAYNQSSILWVVQYGHWFDRVTAMSLMSPILLERGVDKS